MRLTDEFPMQPLPEPPRVVMVLEGIFPAPGGGGAENQVLSLAKFFLAKNLAVSVVTPRQPRLQQPLRETCQGIPVERLPFPKVRWLGGLVLMYQLARWLLRERRNYVAIHAHVAGNMAATCCIVGRWLGKPVTVKYTGFVDVERRAATTRWPARLRDRALRRATWIQATSRRIADNLVRTGYAPEQIRRIPNAVDLERFASARARRLPLRQGMNLAASSLVVVYCGRLAPVKGVHVLLEAWDRAFADRPEARLLIAGHGTARERQRLNAQAAQLRGAARIAFLGAQPRVEDVIGAADFTVLPSLAEGLSNSLLESMASAVPVLGTRVSGTEDFIEEGVTGWICEPDDAEQMAAALLRAASASPEQRDAMGGRARESVAMRVSIDTVGAQLADLYGLAHLGGSRPDWRQGGKPCAA